MVSAKKKVDIFFFLFLDARAYICTFMNDKRRKADKNIVGAV